MSKLELVQVQNELIYLLNKLGNLLIVAETYRFEGLEASISVAIQHLNIALSEARVKISDHK